MTREQAIEKIKKLQALKEGAVKIDSDGEAKNAAAIIDKLQKQFGITMQEVYASYTSTKKETTQKKTSKSTSSTTTERQTASNNQYRNSPEANKYAESLKAELKTNFHKIVNSCKGRKNLDERLDEIIQSFNYYAADFCGRDDVRYNCNYYSIDLRTLVDRVKQQNINSVRKEIMSSKNKEKSNLNEYGKGVYLFNHFVSQKQNKITLRISYFIFLLSIIIGLIINDCEIHNSFIWGLSLFFIIGTFLICAICFLIQIKINELTKK